MPIDVNGTSYFTADDIYRDVGVGRQTLWRWRSAQVIPPGRRYRGKRILFTGDEVETIRNYANRLEPAELSGTRYSRLDPNSARQRKAKPTVAVNREPGDAR